jgi:hypothetical protein
LPAGLCSFLNFPWTIPFLLYLRPKLLLVMDCIALIILVPLYIEIARRAGAVGVAALTSAAMVVRTTIHQWLAWRMVGRRSTTTNGLGQQPLDAELEFVRTT